MFHAFGESGCVACSLGTMCPTDDAQDPMPDVPPQVQEPAQEAGDGDVEPAQEAGDGDVEPALPLAADFPADGEELVVVVEASAMRETQRQWDTMMDWIFRRVVLMARMREKVDQLGTLLSEVMDGDDGFGRHLPKKPRVMGAGSSCMVEIGGIARMVNGSFERDEGLAAGAEGGRPGASSSASDSSGTASESGRRSRDGLESRDGRVEFWSCPDFRPAWMSRAEWEAFLAREEERDDWDKQ